MIKVHGEKGCGKTSSLIAIAEQNKACVVCEDPAYVLDHARRLGYAGIDATTYVAFAYGNAEENKKYMIDDIDKYLAFVDVIGYSETVGQDD